MNRHLVQPGDMDDEGFDDFAEDDSKQFLFMEVESTANFKGFDIDKMMEHTSIEDFMKQVYSSRGNKKALELSKMQESGKLSGTSSLDVIKQIIEGGDVSADVDEDDEYRGPQLNFGDESGVPSRGQTGGEINENTLKKQALENLKVKRSRLRQSTIFNAAD